MKKPIQQVIRPRAQTESVQGRHFYSHLIEIDIIYAELESMEMSSRERNELKDIVSKNIHHSVLDNILSMLSSEDKKIFLKFLADKDHSKLWEHLSAKIVDIEKKLKKIGERLQRDFLKDIKEVKSKIV